MLLGHLECLRAAAEVAGAGRSAGRLQVAMAGPESASPAAAAVQLCSAARWTCRDYHHW